MKPHWLFLGCSVSALSFSAQHDISGSKDHVLFPRHPAYYIASYQVNDSLTNRPGLQQEEAPVQGTLYDITYRLKTGTPAKAPGKLELIRFYEERLKTLPGKKTKTFKGVPGRELLGGGVQKGNMEHMINVAYWELTKHGPDSICTGYRVQVTERPVVKEYSSAEISSALKNRGQIALDIRFASGKSVIAMYPFHSACSWRRCCAPNPALRSASKGTPTTRETQLQTKSCRRTAPWQ